MAGILTEAFLLETFTIIFGRNLFRYILGAVFALFWTLFQKIINLIVLYGLDLIKIAESFYVFLVKKTNLDGLNPKYLIITVLLIYAFAAIISELAAYFAVKKVNVNTNIRLKYTNSQNTVDKLFVQKEQTKYSFLNLIFVIVFAGFSLFLITKTLNYISATIGILFVAFILYRYKNSLRHLKKKSVWIQFFIITFFATLFREHIQTGKYFSQIGFKTGL